MIFTEKVLQEFARIPSLAPYKTAISQGWQYLQAGDLAAAEQCATKAVGITDKRPEAFVLAADFTFDGSYWSLGNQQTGG
jgi:hypothetical protein